MRKLQLTIHLNRLQFMNKLLSIIIVVGLIYGCSSVSNNSSNTFYNVNKLNTDIEKYLDLDLMALKKKADLAYSKDSTFYIELIQTYYKMDSAKCFERANIPVDPLDSQGNKLNVKNQSDSLALLMISSFAESIILDNCTDSSQDSLCIYKMKWKRAMEKSNPKEQQMWHGSFHSPFKKLIDKDFLSEEEQNYMILFLHYLGRLSYSN